jgi:hypothetical protein
MFSQELKAHTHPSQTAAPLLIHAVGKLTRIRNLFMHTELPRCGCQERCRHPGAFHHLRLPPGFMAVAQEKNSLNRNLVTASSWCANAEVWRTAGVQFSCTDRLIQRSHSYAFLSSMRLTSPAITKYAKIVTKAFEPTKTRAELKDPLFWTR